MFLRLCGKQVLILHSYRDGRGRVRHHHLGRILALHSEDELKEQWERIYRLYPTRSRRIRELWQQTLTLWRRLPKGGRQRLPNHTSVLERLLEQGTREFGRLEILETLAMRRQAREQRDRTTITRYARHLCDLGYGEACQREMERLPGSDGWALVNKAALLWRQHRKIEAFEAAMKGLARAPEILPSLELLHKGKRTSPDDYWQHYGELWGEAGRHFLLQLWNQTLVKCRTARMQEGARPRRLVKDHSRGWLRERLGLVS